MYQAEADQQQSSPPRRLVVTEIKQTQPLRANGPQAHIETDLATLHDAWERKPERLASGEGCISGCISLLLPLELTNR